MSSRSPWSLSLAFFLAAGALWSSCEQDPLRIPNLGDGGLAGDAAPDAFMPDVVQPDGGAPADVRPDLSYDACIAQPEVCNNVDDNCNGLIDEGFDKLNSYLYCEECKGCLHLLELHVSIPGCDNGKCTIVSCEAGWIDLNGDVSDGCEYECTPSGVEVCDGIDNDCNGLIDDGVQLKQQICKTLGACAGTTAVCKGADGWVCQYGPDVELQPCTKDEDCGIGNRCIDDVCPNLVIFNETRCDGKDNDCDGLADDPWLNPALPDPLGAECNPTPAKSCNNDSDCDPAAGSTCLNNFCSRKKGECRDVGVVACKADGSGSECKLTKAGKAPGPELCNGKDDDCDGVIDNDPVDEQWVNAGAVQIFKYEASRPDATASASGIQSQGRACSVPGRLPWANVTRHEAQAACQAAGARLCTAAEWAAACRGPSSYTYPYGDTYDPAKCNGRAYDPNDDKLLVTDQPASCVSDWGAAGQVLNMSGNVKEWVKTGTAYELRGGAYDTPSIEGGSSGLSCSYELPAPPTTLRLPTLGFRCCK